MSSKKGHPIFDLNKVPDAAIIQHLLKTLTHLRIERGKDQAFIEELEHKISLPSLKETRQTKELNEIKQKLKVLTHNYKQLKRLTRDI